MLSGVKNYGQNKPKWDQDIECWRCYFTLGDNGRFISEMNEEVGILRGEGSKVEDNGKRPAWLTEVHCKDSGF